ncbi:MAG TPA: IPTL-CTERM sorting domain-containing protein [Thermoanaerobaculia bacterium]|nr:IPTL-CTERM sorting domain-containing protein [Thermoanaerobaculia bacterium]
MAQTVWINEIHYDNSGADTQEGVEVAGPAGTDLTGWTIVPYNGNTPANALTYAPTGTLAGTIPNQSNGYGTVYVAIAGLQNGPNDGLALVNSSNTVVQFLSYEGVITAGNGVASGMTSTDIGVSQAGTQTDAFTIQLQGTGNQYSDFTWAAGVAATRGAVNTGQTFTAGVPTLNINDVSQVETNAGTTTFQFTVSLTAAAAGNVTFDIATADNTATDANNDYEPNSATGVTILAGNTTSTFNVTVNGDANIEASETFFVNVTNIAGANAGDTQGQGTITNDDSPPVLTIADVSQAEGNAATAPMTFTVTLDAPAPPGGVTFDIATSDGTATDADNDYEPNSVIGATIAEGNTTYTFDVTINGDTLFEPNETFTVTVTNVTVASPGDTTATGTINNDDALPTLAIDDVAVLEGNAGTQSMTFTVTLSAASSQTVTVEYATTDSSATTADSDYVPTSGTLTFLAGDTSETISVTINGDTNIEGDEQFFITLSSPANATTTDQGFGIIKSDDPASIAAINTAYAQNFNTLETSAGATTPATWTFAEAGTAANNLYAANNGGSNTGNTYSYGPTGDPDRAFGTLLSGSLTSTIGAQYENNTGEAITTLSIAYTGEQWRLGGTSRADRLDFEYSTDATSLTTGAWTAVNQLDFSSPFTSANAGDLGQRDGNSAPNRTSVAYTISGLNIPDGATFWIRWTDFNAAGSDDGLAIDDFSIIANIAGGVLSINDAPVVFEGNAGTTTATFTVTLSQPAGVGGVSFDIATADNTATVADNDYVANSVIGAVIPEGQTQYTFDVTINGDTNVEWTETFFVNVTNIGGAAPSDTQGIGTIRTEDFPAFTRIHAVQGSGNVSPMNGANVTISGIVTGIKSGGSGGFFVQEEEAEYDAFATTSEGIFVFTGGSLPAGVAIGNQVVVNGTVVEFPASASPHGVTELSTVTVEETATGQPLPAPAVLTAADATPSSNISQYERFEGMRVTAASFTVVAPTQGSIDEVNATASSNGVFYVVVTGTPRPFREEGLEQTATVPSEAPCAACIPRFDMNPEKLRVDSDNQPGATQLNVTAGQTITNMVGVLDFGFFEYTILPNASPEPIVAGDSTYDPVPVRTATELTVSSFNLQRLYDTVNDDNDPGPADGIDDVIVTPAALNNRLNKASLAIRNVLRNPDVLGVVEVDNLPTLQALAARINSDNGGSTNYVAYLEEGNDVGGIDVGFLVNENRVSVQSVTQIGKTATFVDPGDNSVDTLNDRPSLVLEASILRPDNSVYEFVTIVNHLRSLNGVETNDNGGRRVRAKRAAQAEYLANYVQSRQVADPEERIILVGDFNAFEVNDGYVDMIGTILGTPAPADEVVRSSPDLVDPNLIDLIFTLPQEQRYSYTFDGNAQVLDHAIVNEDMFETFTRLAYARLDADFPQIFFTDPTRPERLSDHDAPVAYFDIATPSQISIGDANVTEGNAGTATLTFTVTLDTASAGEVTVGYATSNGTATAGSDYAAETGTVTFAAGDTSETITIDVTGDTAYELDETLTVTLSNVTGNATLLDASGTGTILNDDPVVISIADSNVVEGNAGTSVMTFTVTLNAAPTSPVTVNYTTSDGSATAGSDYVAENGTITFLQGDMSETITIDVTGDVLFEPNETFTITLSSPSANGAISDGEATGTILNDDGVTLINISDANVTEGNAGLATLTFTVTLTQPAAENVTVNYTTSDGTATVANADYVAEAGTVTFTPGDQSETITIDVTGDPFFEGNETLTVTLSNASVNANIADGTGTGTINNDDAISVLNISDANVTEGNAGTTTLTFDVTLDSAAAGPVTVNYATSNGTATAGSDYVAANGTLTFVPGDLSEQIVITVNGDTSAEPNETLTVTLSTPSPNASINDGTGTGTINNDDAGSVTLDAAMVINPPSPPAGAPFTKTITVTNSGAGTATNVTVTDDLPAGLTLVSATSSQGSCNAVDPVVCNLGSILAGGSATVTITVIAAAPGPVTNTATVGSDQTGPDGGTDSETFTVTPAGTAAAIPTLSEYALFALMALLGALALTKLR